MSEAVETRPCQGCRRELPYGGNGRPTKWCDRCRAERPDVPRVPCGCGCGESANPGCRYVAGHQCRKSPHEYLADPESGCWIWQRATNDSGYGQKWVEGKRFKAHRWYFEQVNGPIPEGMTLDHTCLNGSGGCVNPEHMRLATKAENNQNIRLCGQAGRGTRFRGVEKVSRRWSAVVSVGGRRQRLGTFDTEVEAALVASAYRAEHMPFSLDAADPEGVRREIEAAA